MKALNNRSQEAVATSTSDMHLDKGKALLKVTLVMGRGKWSGPGRELRWGRSATRRRKQRAMPPGSRSRRWQGRWS
jgi:hypothetical protein